MNRWRSLLSASNPSSCMQAVSLYEKILENDAVRVYHDLVWRRNPIKMMKKPHLRTSQGWARVLRRSVEGAHREREVITVVKLTGNVASPWRLVMIAAAGNNKTPTLSNYWPASLALDKSNNAHYPHIPLLWSHQRGCRGSKWDLPLRKLSGLTAQIDWRKTSCSAATALELSLSPRCCWLLLFFFFPPSCSLYLFFHNSPVEDKKSQNDTRRRPSAAWNHDRHKPQTFATGKRVNKIWDKERNRRREKEVLHNKYIFIHLHIVSYLGTAWSTICFFSSLCSVFFLKLSFNCKIYFCTCFHLTALNSTCLFIFKNELCSDYYLFICLFITISF